MKYVERGICNLVFIIYFKIYSLYDIYIYNLIEIYVYIYVVGYFYLEKDINVYKFEKCVYIRILKIYN